MPNGSYYTFGEFRFDPKGRVLFRSGEMVPLFPKAAEVLACLVESHGQVTTKEDLLARVWPDTFVEESTLTRSISVLRKALGDTPDGRTFIVTIPKRGYRFVAEVREERGGDGFAAAALPPQTVSRTQTVNHLSLNRSQQTKKWIAGL
ncbi:MAG TPA: transcriptional regulator, partial [Candidatus Acidoferrum sp.]